MFHGIMNNPVFGQQAIAKTRCLPGAERIKIKTYRTTAKLC